MFITLMAATASLWPIPLVDLPLIDMTLSPFLARPSTEAGEEGRTRCTWIDWPETNVFCQKKKLKKIFIYLFHHTTRLYRKWYFVLFNKAMFAWIFFLGDGGRLFFKKKIRLCCNLYLDFPVLAVRPSRQRDPGRSHGGGAVQNQHQDVVAGGAEQEEKMRD